MKKSREKKLEVGYHNSGRFRDYLFIPTKFVSIVHSVSHQKNAPYRVFESWPLRSIISVLELEGCLVLTGKSGFLHTVSK